MLKKFWINKKDLKSLKIKFKKFKFRKIKTYKKLRNNYMLILMYKKYLMSDNKTVKIKVNHQPKKNTKN